MGLLTFKTTNSMKAIINSDLKSKIDSVFEATKKSYSTYSNLEDIDKNYLHICTGLMLDLDLTCLEALCFSCIYNDSISSNMSEVTGLADYLRISDTLIPDVNRAVASLNDKRLVIMKNDKTGYGSQCFVLDIILYQINNDFKSGSEGELKEKMIKYGKLTYQLSYYPNFLIAFKSEIVNELRSNNTANFQEVLDQFFSNDTDLLMFSMVTYKASCAEKFNDYNFITIENMASIDEGGNVVEGLFNGKGFLFDEKLLNMESDRFNGTSILLGEKGLELVFSPKLAIYAKGQKPQFDTGAVHEPHAIKSIDLYFDEQIGNSIQKLENLLLPAEYTTFCKRMENTSFNKGLNILLYGDPGTGKTELVMQLAKKSNRKIFKVDASMIRDKWVGNSEKNLSKIFNEYALIQKKSGETPILLFNEADSLISKRFAVNYSTDQMNNSMQNILLEKLESFEGILMATTNNIDSIDTAFDRRFLFKLKFDRPNNEIRFKILKDKLHYLNEEAIYQIVGRHNLSGGEIANVCKKIEIEILLNGNNPDMDTIHKICEEELNMRKNHLINIGFKSIN